MANRRVTQETFDAAVRENMEEFEMDPEEALRDAVEQFESQGKTITEIDTKIKTRICGCLRYRMLLGVPPQFCIGTRASQYIE